MVAVEAIHVLELVIDLKCGSRHGCLISVKGSLVDRNVNFHLESSWLSSLNNGHYPLLFVVEKRIPSSRDPRLDP